SIGLIPDQALKLRAVRQEIGILPPWPNKLYARRQASVVATNGQVQARPSKNRPALIERRSTGKRMTCRCRAVRGRGQDKVRPLADGTPLGAHLMLVCTHLQVEAFRCFPALFNILKQ